MVEGFLKKTDPEIYEIELKELERQRNTLGLIPSENYASAAVLEAQASVLQNKYAEGYPGKRYYGGNQFVDMSESLAIERAKKLFGAGFANVQVHAGAPMNMAVYFALLELGDKFMGLQLSQGGHLTHGSPVNFSGKWYKVAAYALNQETEMLDYDAIRKIALAEKPKLIECGYTAYPRQIDFKRFREIADEVGALLMADVSHIAGLIAGGAHPSPIPHAHVTTTTTHKTLRGPRGGLVLSNDAVIAQKIDKAVFPGLQGGPFEHIIAAKAVCFKEAMTPEFSEYAHQIVKNAKALADELMAQGFRLVSGGTDTHLMLIDFTKTHPQMSGKDAQIKLEAVGIICNKNTVPGETRSPFVTSGVRLGTPMMTTRGMKEGEMKVVGGLIAKALKAGDEATVNKIKYDVLEICKRFPIYSELG